MNDPMTVFGGTLIRTAAGKWQWSDGAPEPRVRDLTRQHCHNFRCMTDGTGQTYVEVLLSAAHRDPEAFRWVLEGVAAGKYRQGMSGDHTGPWMINDEGIARMRIEPGEDPLLGHEPIIHKRAIPKVALVPIEQWDAWARGVCGASWDQADEAAILERARALGWSLGR